MPDGHQRTVVSERGEGHSEWERLVHSPHAVCALTGKHVMVLLLLRLGLLFACLGFCLEGFLFLPISFLLLLFLSLHANPLVVSFVSIKQKTKEAGEEDKEGNRQSVGLPCQLEC